MRTFGSSSVVLLTILPVVVSSTNSRRSLQDMKLLSGVNQPALQHGSSMLLLAP
jgi:hypothetical protein